MNQEAGRLVQIHNTLGSLTSSPYSHDVVELALATAWTSQGLTDTVWWSLEHGRTYEQSTQLAECSNQVHLHQRPSTRV